MIVEAIIQLPIEDALIILKWKRENKEGKQNTLCRRREKGERARQVRVDSVSRDPIRGIATNDVVSRIAP